MNEIILEIKKKGEFSKLPDSVVERVAKIAKGDVKASRALLRKYFGVFLTNKVLKIKNEEVLRSHISSKDRGYSSFYQNIFDGTNEFESVVDIGCGVNGFSYKYLEEVLGSVSYIGVEAVGQVVGNMNEYFKENEFNAKAICEDVFNSEKMKQIIISQHSPRVILLLQVLDALEGFEKNSSKKLLLAINETLGEKDLIVITMPMKSISGKTKFEASRNWLRYFLEDNFKVEEFLVGNEMVFRARKNRQLL
jgi:hypothetical protein